MPEFSESEILHPARLTRLQQQGNHGRYAIDVVRGKLAREATQEAFAIQCLEIWNNGPLTEDQRRQRLSNLNDAELIAIYQEWNRRQYNQTPQPNTETLGARPQPQTPVLPPGSLGEPGPLSPGLTPQHLRQEIRRTREQWMNLMDIPLVERGGILHELRQEVETDNIEDLQNVLRGWRERIQIVEAEKEIFTQKCKALWLNISYWDMTPEQRAAELTPEQQILVDREWRRALRREPYLGRNFRNTHQGSLRHEPDAETLGFSLTPDQIAAMTGAVPGQPITPEVTPEIQIPNFDSIPTLPAQEIPLVQNPLSDEQILALPTPPSLQITPPIMPTLPQMPVVPRIPLELPNIVPDMNHQSNSGPLSVPVTLTVTPLQIQNIVADSEPQPVRQPSPVPQTPTMTPEQPVDTTDVAVPPPTPMRRRAINLGDIADGNFFC